MQINIFVTDVVSICEDYKPGEYADIIHRVRFCLNKKYCNLFLRLLQKSLHISFVKIKTDEYTA